MKARLAAWRRVRARAQKEISLASGAGRTEPRRRCAGSPFRVFARLKIADFDLLLFFGSWFHRALLCSDCRKQNVADSAKIDSRMSII
jgi:hypothetical protein